MGTEGGDSVSERTLVPDEAESHVVKDGEFHVVI